MLPPLVETNRHGGFRVSFREDIGEPAFVVFDMDEIETRGSALIALITARTPIAGASTFGDGIAIHERVVLTDGYALYRVGQRLGDRIPAPVSGAIWDWGRLLGEAAALVGKALRRTDEPVNLATLYNTPVATEEPYLIERLLAAGVTNILYAPGGTGKSLLALRMAVSVAAGLSLMALRVTDKGPVLYLDWEDTQETMLRRYRAVCNGLSVPIHPDIHYINMTKRVGNGPYERYHGDVTEWVEKIGARLVILDSTGLALNGATGDNMESAIRLFALLSTLPATVLLLDHVSGEDLRQSGAAKPYGSVYKINAARNVWEMKRLDQAGDVVTLRHRKTNMAGYHNDIGVQMAWSGESVVIRDATPLWDDIP
jgi:hypothetical protein